MAKFDKKQFDTPELQEAMQAYLKGNYETAYNMFCELAGENNGRAMYFLGRFFAGIPGVNVVKRSFGMSSAWYKLGANRGDDLATLQTFEDMDLTDEETVSDISISEFNDCLEAVKAMAIEGDVFAKMEMYYTYVFSIHVKRDDKEALKWCREAAEAGNPDGMMQLGFSYDGGLGVEKDYEEARRWYQKAAELNNTRAMFLLGWLYSYGNGVKQNHEEAFKWYMQAAELNDDNAMFKLGVIYDASEPDHGVEKNYAEAVRWYQKAYDFGSAKAERKLKELLK